MSLHGAGIFLAGFVLGIVPGIWLGGKARIVRGLLRGFHSPPACSFCGVPGDQAYRLLGGAFSVYICDRCASLGREVLRSRSSRGDRNGRLEFLSRETFYRCSFCGKGSDDREMFAGLKAQMCAPCSEIAQGTLRTA